METQQIQLEPGKTLNLKSTAYTEFQIVTKGGTKLSGSVTANNSLSVLAGDDLASFTITIPKEGNERLHLLSSD